VARYRRGLARAGVDYALAARDEGDLAPGETVARRVLGILTDLGGDRLDDDLAGRVAEVRTALAVVLITRTRPGEAAREIDAAEATVRRLKAPEWQLPYNLACARALLGAAVPPGPDHDAQFDRALANLRLALRAGCRDAAYVRADPDLESLRPRADFQALLLDMAFPADPFAR
jgi:hypothetical protein